MSQPQINTLVFVFWYFLCNLYIQGNLYLFLYNNCAKGDKSKLKNIPHIKSTMLIVFMFGLPLLMIRCFLGDKKVREG